MLSFDSLRPDQTLTPLSLLLAVCLRQKLWSSEWFKSFDQGNAWPRSTQESLYKSLNCKIIKRQIGGKSPWFLKEACDGTKL